MATAQSRTTLVSSPATTWLAVPSQHTTMFLGMTQPPLVAAGSLARWRLFRPRHLDRHSAPFGHRLLEGAGIAPRSGRNLVELVERFLGQAPAARLQCLAELLGIAGADDGRGHERLVHHPAQRRLCRRAADLLGD